MDEALLLTDRVADAGQVIDTEPCFELTPEAFRYLAAHQSGALEDEADL